ncbi:ABC transporter ATP-binding protein [Paracoccus pantotrophus]|uniref:ABC transporter ATP-binding protein n=1 Tax=Paracoccus pantotrophus TaxID=82367 RepID=UPI000E08D185|nr:ABC transporter ATP-binding protein [Paracoccus pantotrophus]RDD95283.1 ABC transporter ATP-binding protein [Paracoccus pantotrophus]WGR64175.1 ABC transporter ATP-binding protein [Paracoccus pantotrophus]
MNSVLEIRGLQIGLRQDPAALIVNGLDLSIGRGEVVALVGESGSGKTMTAFSILNLLPAAARVIGGSIRLGETDVLSLPPSGLRSLRGRKAAIVFQEPMTSLNPLMPIGRQIAEMIHTHETLPAAEVQKRVVNLLELVRMPDARRRVNDYPHNLSGGLRQRVMIAMALACNPDLLIADEPTTALDVTIQAQILKLLLELRDRSGMAVLLITHDLGVVSEVADRVAVMYGGQIVELADVETLFRNPRHPYTNGLLACLPEVGGASMSRLQEVPGLPPRPGEIVRGCPFAPRCPSVQTLCRETAPPFTPLGDTVVSCHFPQGTP